MPHYRILLGRSFQVTSRKPCSPLVGFIALIIVAIIIVASSSSSSSLTVNVVEDKPRFFADKLHKAMKGLGTDDDALMRIVVSR